MASDVSIRVGVDGAAEFKTAIRSMNGQIRTLDSEMRALTSGIDNLDDAEAAAAQRMDVMSRKIQLTGQRIQTLTEEYDRQAAKLEELGRAQDEAMQSNDTAAITRATNAYNHQQQVVNDLTRQLNSAQADMNRFEREMRDIENGTDRLTQSFRDTGNAADDMGNSFADAFTAGAVSGAVQSMISGISGLIDSTMEYQRIMASLETSSQHAGYTAEQTEASYRQLYQVLGDEQSSATALANFQALGLSQTELTRLIDSAIGAWATYGDSIPIDSLAEAVNETVKVGTVTGTFADVLNWAGTSEDDFNDKLAACTDEQERMQLVMDELSRQGLPQMADAFRQNNAALIETNDAQAQMQDALAQTTEAVMPLAASITSGLASALTALQPTIQTIIEKVQDFTRAVIDFVSDNRELASVISTVAIAFLSFSKISTAITAIKGFVTSIKGMITAMRSAQTASQLLNTTLMANPWGLAAAAVSVFVGALATLAVSSINTEDSLDSLTDKIDEQAESWKELADASQEKAEGELAQIEQARKYIEELQGMVDANGRVTEAESARAAGLYELVNQLLPGLVQKTGEGEKATYSFADSIDTLIEKQKALALQEAYQDDYVEAIKGKQEAVENLTKLYGEQAKWQEQYNKYGEAYAKGELERTNQAIEKQTELLGTYDQTITKVETLNTAIASGDYESASQMVDNFGLSLQNLGNMSVAQLTEEYNQLKTAIAGIENQLNSGGLEESQRSALQGVLNQLNGYLPQYEAQMNALGAGGINSFSEGTTVAAPSAVNAVDNVRLQAINALNMGNQPSELGSDGISNYATGIVSNVANAVSASESVRESAIESLESSAEALSKGAEAGSSYGEGMSSSSGDVGSIALGIAQTASANLDDYAGAKTSGQNMTAGFLAGFTGDSIYERARTIIRNVQNIVSVTMEMHSPSRWMKRAGKNIVEGLAIGLESNSAEKAIENQIRSIMDAAVDLSDTLGKALLKKEDELNNAIAEMDAEAAEKQAAEELATYKQNLKEKYDELGKAEKKEKAKIQAEIDKLQKDWNDKQLETQEKAAKEQLQAQLSALQEYKQEYESALQEIEQSQQSMADKLMDYGELFETITDEETGVSFIELGDLEEEINAIERYGDALEQLKSRGVPEGLLDEVVNLNIDDAIAYTDQLLNMTDDQYEKYMQLWEQKQEAAEEVARKFYQDEMDAMTREFVDKIPGELSDVKDEMRTIGVNSIQGMINGIKSMSGMLSDAARQVISDALSAMRSEADIHSPSKKTENLIGKPLAQGIEVGFLDQLVSIKNTMASAIMAPFNRVTTTDLYGATAGMVNGMAAAAPPGGGIPIITVPVYLNKRQIAEAMYDPLKQVGKQRGY
jgi:chromosome segregation ATPase